ncbi:hypothetical protein KRR26_32645 [Corallococcus sp. M34]|uniref:hypothetical protein n=1 Tax=Citreicoccus inhibens TaxID=2849499 RepID=UPI001C24164A|nr:hypothetical protein [Citreicoccus inhibens]MBU8900368.1 hypothetical protein [Citreicoccus inhibens]
MSLLVESLSAWYGMPLYAVVDADAQEARGQPGLWAKLLGDLAFNPNIAVEWTRLPLPKITPMTPRRLARHRRL